MEADYQALYLRKRVWLHCSNRRFNNFRFKADRAFNLMFEVFGSHSFGRREPVGQVSGTIEASLNCQDGDGRK
jgi:hypothetical protein